MDVIDKILLHATNSMRGGESEKEWREGGNKTMLCLDGFRDVPSVSPGRVVGRAEIDGLSAYLESSLGVLLLVQKGSEVVHCVCN